MPAAVTPTEADPALLAAADIRAIALEISGLSGRVGILEKREQLPSSTVETSDGETMALPDLVDTVVDTAATTSDLDIRLEANETAVSAAQEIARAATEAATEAGEAGIAAAAEAGEAADEALANAADAKANAIEALSNAASAVAAAVAAQTAVADVDAKATQADEKAVLAAQDAANALSGAQAAQGAADAATAKALEAAGLVAGKGAVYAQPDPPTPVDLKGLWIDTDDGNKPYRGKDTGSITRTNYSEHPSPEDGSTTGYAPNPYSAAGTLDVTTDRFHSGTRSWRYTALGGANGEGIAFSVPAGQRYASLWVYNPSAGGVDHLGITGIANDASSQIPVSRTTVRDAWVRLTIDLASTAGGSVVVYVDEVTSPAGAAFYWDDVLIGDLDDYIDGSMPGGAWSGTPWLSTSTVTGTGPAWVLVQDADIQAAAAAAVQAQQDADAAVSAAAAAAGKADQAAAAASAAQASADGKTTDYYSPNAPTAATPGKTLGDTWFVRMSNTGIVTGHYEWDGSAWQQRTLDNAVLANLDAGKITTGYLDALRIAAGTITGTHIAAQTIQTANLAAAAITTDLLAANAVTAAKIAADTITSREIAADAITAAELAADAVLARNIKAGEITAGKIAANAIAAANIQAGAIGADQIAANAVTAVKIAANAITATAIAAGAIDGKTITGATIRTAASGKRTILSGTSIQFVADNEVNGGSISATSNGSARAWVTIAAGSGGGAINVGPYDLPVSGTVGVQMTNAYINNLFVDNVYSANTNSRLTGNDTGWVNPGGFVNGFSRNTYQVRIIGNRVWMKGQINRSSQLPTSSTKICAFSGSYVPPQRTILLATTTAGNSARIEFATDGSVNILDSTSGSGSYAILDGLWYFID